MAFSFNSKGAKSPASDPNKTGDLSAAAQASAKPTRRSARGSEVAKQEKKDRREKKAREADAEKARAAARKERIEAAHAHVAATGGIPQSRRSVEPASARGAAGGAAGGERAVAQGRPVSRHNVSAEIASGKGAKAGKSAKAGGTTGKKHAIGGVFAGIASRFAGAAASAGSHDPASQQAFLKYANDNAVVRWFYQFTTGPQRHVFYLIVVALLAVGVYLPVRDLYIANRTAQILSEQKAIRDKYNESIADQAKQWLSEEGVKDTARKDLNMVMPGETPIEVEGLDEDGNPIVVQDKPAAGSTGTDGKADGESDSGDADKDDADAEGDEPGAEDGASSDAKGPDASKDRAGAEQDSSTTDGDDESDQLGYQQPDEENAGMLKGEDASDKSKTGKGAQEYDPTKDPETSAEVEAAEQAVFENSPWWWKVLDVLFFYDGVNGMAVVSTGE